MVPADLAYPIPVKPTVGDIVPIVPGVNWVRMDLPFQLNHINLWLLEDGDGWTIVDTGIWNDETVAAWEKIFADHLRGRPVTRVIVTHFHPDHSGLAGILCRRWNVELWMTRLEWLHARLGRLDIDHETIEHQTAFYRRAGSPQDFLDHLVERGSYFPQRVSPVPREYRRIRDGEAILIGGRAWHVIVGTGHAPEHACLHCPELGILISGDQVLPRITPNVSVWASEPDGNPLQDFLASIAKLRALPAETLVLPSHNEPFTGLHQRLDYLARHHDDRLDDLAAALDRPKTAMEAASVLFRRPLDHHSTAFAIGETLSHLHLLAARGRAHRTLDPDGRQRYARA